jgi:hypothetical protein
MAIRVLTATAAARYALSRGFNISVEDVRNAIKTGALTTCPVVSKGILPMDVDAWLEDASASDAEADASEGGR